MCFEDAKIIVDKLYADGVLFLRILGGEPFFRNDILDILAYAAEKGMLISFSTNASLIDEKTAVMLKKIEKSLNYFQVSLYGVDDETYEKNTGNKIGFQLVKRGLQYLKDVGLNPYAFWVLTPDNIVYLEKAYFFVKSFELPALRISPELNLGRATKKYSGKSVVDSIFWRDVITKLSALNVLAEKENTTNVQLHARPLLGEYLFKMTGLHYFYITCKAATSMVYVDCVGDASPCPFAEFMPDSYRSSYSSSLNKKINLLDESLKEIWNTDVFKQYRELQSPEKNPKDFFENCPHYKSNMCEPCIFTPCTCRDTIQQISSSLTPSV